MISVSTWEHLLQQPVQIRVVSQQFLPGVDIIMNTVGRRGGRVAVEEALSPFSKILSHRAHGIRSPPQSFSLRVVVISVQFSIQAIDVAVWTASDCQFL